VAYDCSVGAAQGRLLMLEVFIEQLFQWAGLAGGSDITL